MAATSITILDNLAPELASLSDSVKSTWLGYAAGLHTASYWGPNAYPIAMGYYAAHMMTMAGLASSSPAAASAATASAAGPVQSQKTQDESVTYANNAATHARDMTDAWLAETAHGRAYLALRNMQPGKFPGLVSGGTIPDPLRRTGLVF